MLKLLYLFPCLSCLLLAHVPNGVQHSGFIRINPDAVTLEYSLEIGPLAADTIRKQIDTDHDKLITDKEITSYLTDCLADNTVSISFTLNNKLLEGQAVKKEMALEDKTIGPVGFSVKYIFTFPIQFSGSHKNVLSFTAASYGQYIAKYNFYVVADKTLDFRIFKEKDSREFYTPLKKGFIEIDSSSFTIEFYNKGLFQYKSDKTLKKSSSFTHKTTHKADNSLIQIMKQEKYSTIFILTAFFIALFFGMAHSLSPGHGKTLVAAYLIGEKGTVGNAIFLGLIVTFTHTFSIIVLGIITEIATFYINRTSVMMVMQLISGAIIIIIGLYLFITRLKYGYSHGHSHGHAVAAEHSHAAHLAAHDHPHGHDHPHDHDHPHGHDHPHNHNHSPDHAGHTNGHAHSHLPEGKITLWRLLTLGVAGGIVPCPTGLVIIAAALAWNKIGLGIFLVAAFSIGIASVLIIIGILTVKAKHLLKNYGKFEKITAKLGILSPFIITFIGILFIIRALIDYKIII